MKLVIAYIQPEKLNAVKQALYEKGIFKMYVVPVLGCGQQKGYHETYRGSDIEVNLLKKTRLEIALNEEFLDATVDAIVQAARSGNIGDGKILILDIADVVRIRTGERGKDAVG
jgi:nitrogen regulatory protein P-II 2